MTEEEFVEKMESEGAYYAFTDWGLHENMLTNHDTDFYRDAKAARESFQNADLYVNRLYG